MKRINVTQAFAEEAGISVKAAAKMLGCLKRAIDSTYKGIKRGECVLVPEIIEIAKADEETAHRARDAENSVFDELTERKPKASKKPQDKRATPANPKPTRKADRASEGKREAPKAKAAAKVAKAPAPKARKVDAKPTITHKPTKKIAKKPARKAIKPPALPFPPMKAKE